MENYIKSIEHDGDMVIIRRRSGYTKMPLFTHLTVIFMKKMNFMQMYKKYPNQQRLMPFLLNSLKRIIACSSVFDSYAQIPKLLLFG